jgi:hypothetical protein
MASVVFLRFKMWPNFYKDPFFWAIILVFAAVVLLYAFGDNP